MEKGKREKNECFRRERMDGMMGKEGMPWKGWNGGEARDGGRMRVGEGKTGGRMRVGEGRDGGGMRVGEGKDKRG